MVVDGREWDWGAATVRTAARCRSCMIETDTGIFAFIWTYWRSFAFEICLL